MSFDKKAWMKAYRQTPEYKAKQQTPEYKEYMKVYCAARYQEKKVEIERKKTIYRHNNTAAHNARNSKWTRDNRGYATAKCAQYAATKKNQTPEMNAAEWAEINAMYEYNRIMPGKWHVDHIDPLANGGLHHPSNLQILSEHDNCSKGDRI